MRIRLLAAALLLLSGPASADIKAGVDAWARGDYRRAVEEWRGPAVAGDADAQFNLGQAYKLGRGVPVDPQMAESWFRKAALQGHEQAGDNYGLALFQRGAKQDAVRWLEQSVARDEPRAELVYGTMLFNGDGVARDYPRAYALMTRAAAPRPPVEGQPGTDGLASARETLAQMDPFIAAVDRERGTALAQRIAIDAQNRPAPAAGPMRVTEQPPAQVAAILPSPSPAAGRSPGGTRTAQPAGPTPNRGTTAAVARSDSAPPIASRAAPTHPHIARGAATTRAAPANRGRWAVQLGAFRDRNNAQALWTRVGGKLNGAAPAYPASGGITRLQATGFVSRAEAQAACRRARVSCTVIAP